MTCQARQGDMSPRQGKSRIAVIEFAAFPVSRVVTLSAVMRIAVGVVILGIVIIGFVARPAIERDVVAVGVTFVARQADMRSR